ncbi:hypothetical protein B1R38_27875 [Bacillus cereus]|nr:hypothetical protein B1R38_27875 [Bacillus cereus]
MFIFKYYKYVFLVRTPYRNRSLHALFITLRCTTMLFIIYMIKNERSKKIKIILYVFLTLDILIFLFLINMTYIVTTSLKYY